jgi:glutamate racemase
MATFKPESPIGIFDSGIGGLTVANSIIRHMPNESIVYFGDTAHMPYGEKSADAIRYYSLRIGKFLLDQGCKMIVIACNSASSAAYHTLLDFFKGQALFVNVVDPLVNYTLNKQYERIGVIATKATIHSRIYEQKIREKNQNAYVYSLATPLLAPMIEEGFAGNNISKSIIETYLSDPGFKDIEALLLACTHYPLIRKEIESYFGFKVDVVDSTEAVANEVKDLLSKHQLLATESQNDFPSVKRSFYVSDLTPSFQETTSVFFGQKINLQQIQIW